MKRGMHSGGKYKVSLMQSHKEYHIQLVVPIFIARNGIILTHVFCYVMIILSNIGKYGPILRFSIFRIDKNFKTLFKRIWPTTLFLKT